MANFLVDFVRRWLVDYPPIKNFEWREEKTLGASPLFPITAICCYLTITILLLGGRLTLRRPTRPLLRLLGVVHNSLLLAVSIGMSLGGFASVLTEIPSPSWVVCFPAGATPRKGPVFFWAHVFYLSKIYELLDTLFVLLRRDGAGNISFLHVYHHSAVIAVSYVWVSAPQSLMPLGLVGNSSIHVLMYTYYLCCSLGWRWSKRYKRVITDLQIFQFLMSFVASAGFLWFHLGGGGGRCSGPAGWAMTQAFNTSMLALFLNFHNKSYGDGKADAAKIAPAVVSLRMNGKHKKT